MTPLEEKTCPRCRESKPRDAFYNRPPNSRPSSHCKLCTYALAREYAAADPDRDRRYRKKSSAKRYAARRKGGPMHDPASLVERLRRDRMKKYRMSPEQLLALQKAYKDGCAICGEGNKGPRDLSVDHCHVTGKTRGILCNLCNLALGKMQDDPDRLRAAADYLEEAQKSSGYGLRS